MATLTTRTAKLNIVISLKDCHSDKIVQKLTDFCHEYMDIYAFILHDKDILDNGELKTPHIHLVGLYKTNRQRLSTILTNLSETIGLPPLAITIDKMTDLTGSIQYLIHKNNKEKYQYQVLDIVTNITEGELQTYLNSDSRAISIEYLIGIVEQNRSKIEIMRTIGLGNYHLYRNVINDIYREIWELPRLN